nr:hypothetical protein GCM10020093_025680 [Planobispora longispora]
MTVGAHEHVAGRVAAVGEVGHHPALVVGHPRAGAAEGHRPAGQAVGETFDQAAARQGDVRPSVAPGGPRDVDAQQAPAGGLALLQDLDRAARAVQRDPQLGEDARTVAPQRQGGAARPRRGAFSKTST